MSDHEFILVNEEEKEKENEIRGEEENAEGGRDDGGTGSGRDGGGTGSSRESGGGKQEVAASGQEEDRDGYEKICFLCHRPESVTGKMIDLPNHITVCPDCMQKSFDAMTSGSVDLNRLMNMYIRGLQLFNV